MGSTSDTKPSRRDIALEKARVMDDKNAVFCLYNYNQYDRHFRRQRLDKIDY